MRGEVTQALTNSLPDPGRSKSAPLASVISSAGSLVLAAKAAKRARMKVASRAALGPWPWRCVTVVKECCRGPDRAATRV